eukprot:gnl/TRDRNA2_/TRDRNA2_162642_c1_seq2.p2 gnl/TRDRNA2_/TRDRNA2_162642_c1~~gnl/TRDRNA2_/TRDRNA2_162642_c1_seq2.p2  ORF type:complete len:103 (-),score=9.68 gnl/TRDRNA2_/TRDRNA2_162642_c1_seq2:235-543(-)
MLLRHLRLAILAQRLGSSASGALSGLEQLRKRSSQRNQVERSGLDDLRLWANFTPRRALLYPAGLSGSITSAAATSFQHRLDKPTSPTRRQLPAETGRCLES